MKVILDLGCGRNKTANAIGVDNVSLETVDVVADLRVLPLPFAANTVDEIVLSHVIEHLTLNEINALFDETYRILRADGIMSISVPHAMTVAFNTDPTHKSRFTFETFYYFTPQHRFSYYAELEPRWEIKRLTASVNLFSDDLVPLRPWQLQAHYWASRVMTYLVRHSKSHTFPDLVVKTLPLWLVSIHCTLGKASSQVE
jgi:SAM-dependent methyltransferase